MYSEAQLLHQIAEARVYGNAAHPRVLQACQLLADWYAGVGRLNDAAQRWQSLIEELDQLPAAKQMDKAVARVRLADVLQQQSKLEAAQAALWAALDLIRAEPQPPRIDLAFVLNQLAEVSFALGRHETSLTASKNAAAVLVGVVAEEHAELRRTRNNLAAVHGLRGEFAMAERLFRQNLKALATAYGEHDAALVVPYQNLAQLYRGVGRLEEAHQLLQRAHELASRRLGAANVLTLHGLSLQADLWEFAGDLSEAERLQRHVLELRRDTLPADHPTLARSLIDLGNLLWKRGRGRDAEPLLDEALRIQEQVFGQHHPQTAAVWCALSRIYLAAGRLANAERAAQQALGIQQLTLHPQDAALIETHRQLALVAAARQDHQRALEAVTQAQDLLRSLPTAPDCLRFGVALTAVKLALDKGQAEAAAELLNDVKSLRSSITIPLADRVTFRRLSAEWALAAGRLDEAHESCQRAFSLFERLATHPPLAAAELAAVAAETALRQCRYADVTAFAEQELRFREKLHQGDSLAAVPALVRLADAFIAGEKYAEAEPVLQRALAIAEHSYAAPLRLQSELIERLGRLQILQQKFDAFRPWMQRSIALLEQSEGKGDASACEEWVELLRTAGQSDQADELTDQLIELRNRQTHVLGDLW